MFDSQFQNSVIPFAIQKRLNDLFAGENIGFSGPQIIAFFSQYSKDVERYPWAGSPTRKQMLEGCLAKFDLDRQKSIISELINYDGPMKYDRPSQSDLEKIREWLTESVSPVATCIVPIDKISWAHVHQEWAKASKRVTDDPAAAITSARSLIESVCKHVLTEKNQSYDNSWDMQRLYKTAAVALSLSPEQQTEEIFRKILGGCFNIADGMAGLRNNLGDAHGKSQNDPQVDIRHARMAVNAAGTVSTFFIETLMAESQ